MGDTRWGGRRYSACPPSPMPAPFSNAHKFQSQTLIPRTPHTHTYMLHRHLPTQPTPSYPTHLADSDHPHVFVAQRPVQKGVDLAGVLREGHEQPRVEVDAQRGAVAIVVAQELSLVLRQVVTLQMRAGWQV